MTTPRLKFSTTVVAGQSPASSDVFDLTDGQPFLQGKAEFGNTYPLPRYECAIATKTCEPGDILVSVRAPVGSTNLADQVYGIGRGLAAVRATDIHPGFLRWILEEAVSYLRSESNGSTFEAITAWDIGEVRYPRPTPLAQLTISDYLDRETGEIEVMIGKLDELAGQLKALHRTNLVALGHQLCAPGESARIGLLLAKRSHTVRPDDGVVTAFRDGQVALRSRRREDGFTMSFSEAGYQGVEPGDFVFHGLDGFAGAVGVSEDRGKVSPVYHVCTATSLASERFMAWALRALAANGFLEAYAFTVRQRSVDFRNWTTFAGLPITYIPLDEQVRIADHLDEVTAKIDAMLAKVAELKSLLIERRAALITDVVTGRKAVA